MLIYPGSALQVAELGAEVSCMASERDALDRQVDQMQRDMEEVARQLQVLPHCPCGQPPCCLLTCSPVCGTG